jgi:hypothetical protein
MLASVASAAPGVVLDKDNRWVVDGKPYFALGLSGAPPADLKTPDGSDGWAELASGGVNWMRIGPYPWQDDAVEVQAQMDAAARAGIYGMLALWDLSAPVNAKEEAQLREIIERFKNHPALVAYKDVDEPAWGKRLLAPITKGYEIIKELDPAHPVIMVNAPRNTIEELRKYAVACDGTGVDIYPVSVPMGKHSGLPNKQMSVVGDYTKRMIEVVNNKKPVLLVLQITFSGTTPPGNILVRPTFYQQRYMTYQAIIDGAKGIMYFGGYIALNARDQKFGFNWTYWYDVLKPLFKEIGPGSEIYKVITAPSANDVKVGVAGAKDIECLARKIDGKTYILAAKREGSTVSARLSGLGGSGQADVLYENRAVPVKDGVIVDEFKPNAVHVYRYWK